MDVRRYLTTAKAHYRSRRPKKAGCFARADTALTAEIIASDPFSSFSPPSRSGPAASAAVSEIFITSRHLGAEPCLVKSTTFRYREKPFGSFIERVVQAGHTRQHDGRYLTRALPPLDLTYTRSPLEDPGFKSFVPRDVDEGSLGNLPGGVDGQTYRWLDLDGEGIAGVLADQGGAWLYKHNLGEGRFGAVETVKARPVLAERQGRSIHLMAVAGDGNLDLVDLAPTSPGYHGRRFDAGWEGFRAFRSFPVLDWNDPNLRFVDLTGDGVADILITEDDAFKWHPSLLEDGYGGGVRVHVPRDEEASGPRALFADPTQSIYLADMTGDGLSDIVRIRNGEVCYWPNCGYGCFGAKVTMDCAPWFDPPDLFDQRRIRSTPMKPAPGILSAATACGSISISRAMRLARRVPSGAFGVDNDRGRCRRFMGAAPLTGPRRCPRPWPAITLYRFDARAEAVSRVSTTHGRDADRLCVVDGVLSRGQGAWRPGSPAQFRFMSSESETYDSVSRNRVVAGYNIITARRARARVPRLRVSTNWTPRISGTFPRPATSPSATVDGSLHVPPVLTRTWFHTGVFLEAARHTPSCAGIFPGAGRAHGIAVRHHSAGRPYRVRGTGSLPRAERRDAAPGNLRARRRPQGKNPLCGHGKQFHDSDCATQGRQPLCRLFHPSARECDISLRARGVGSARLA